ncbi:MAG: glycosyltransferase family 4 protein [candidate division KSB1 bacterium]|nr:glycosyltransferase family 4 protein [candidate division KSB1 bacterium]
MRGVERLNDLRIYFVSSYVPRRCGIATFTHDLASAIVEEREEKLGTGRSVGIVAITNRPEGYPYGPEVLFEIREQYKSDYRDAADYLNVSPAEVVCIQHEFGIFGGEYGSHLLALLGNLKKPAVTTLHTVLRQPFDDGQKRVLEEICSLSTLVVVMARKAVEILREVYGVPEDKILFIPHGAPDVPFLDPSYYKDQFQLEGRRVLLTFGLLSPNKGIEYAIRALRRVVEEFPDVAYVVLGATHPEVKKQFGEEYRLSLVRLVEKLGLEQHVFFRNQFVSLEELLRFLIASDLYLTPYLSREQIVSGTLTYALAVGKAVISTPYHYAEETLADDRGLLVPFRDEEALAEAILTLLRDENRRNRLRKNAYQYGRQMIWREVARQYLEAFGQAAELYGRQAARLLIRKKALPNPGLPDINLQHLRLLTDDTGIVQHATYTIPDRTHGYCTDDNGRAAVVATMNWRLRRDPEVVPLLSTYLSFLHHSFNPELRRFRNFLSFDRRWLEEAGSEDCHGRALQALGYVVAFAPNSSILAFATRLFNESLEPALHFRSPRALAFTTLGASYVLTRFPGARNARAAAAELCARLVSQLRQVAEPDWYWFEEVLAYDNARLPQALLVAGQLLKEPEWVREGLSALDWLFAAETNPTTGFLSPVGSNGWYRKGGPRAQFDQQPVEVASLAEAAYEAYRITGEKRWFERIRLAFRWFLGDNDVNEMLYDFATGGCRDGLQPAGVNQNQGAESTLAWLIVLHLMHEVAQDRTVRSEIETEAARGV